LNIFLVRIKHFYSTISKRGDILDKKCRYKPYHGAGVLFWCKNEHDSSISILLGKRLYNPLKGKWSVPGGGYEREDGFISKKFNYRATAMRESYEEIDVKADLNDKAAFFKCHLFFFNWELFDCEVKEKFYPRHYNEFSQLKWFSTNELPKNIPLLLKIQIAKLESILKR
jgi:8-oxo-dGTP pyrophosphatase MutT (NUDIX family)